MQNNQPNQQLNNANPNNNLTQRINLFFKLINQNFPENSFQIKAQLCNNKQLKSYSDLGTTESKMGEELIFDKFFSLDYFFEKEQLLKIQIISPEDKNIDYLVNTTIGTVMGSKNLSFRKEIRSKEIGEEGQSAVLFDLIVDAKNAFASKEILKMKINFRFELKNKKQLEKSLILDLGEVFFTIANKIDGKNYRNIYKSEELINKENVFNQDFNEFVLQKDFVCEKNSDEVLFRFYDSKFKEFGILSTNLNQMKESNCNLNVKEPKTKSLIAVVKFEVKEAINKSFVDYLAEGMQINLVIGIDFTASNGILKTFCENFIKKLKLLILRFL